MLLMFYTQCSYIDIANLLAYFLTTVVGTFVQYIVQRVSFHMVGGKYHLNHYHLELTYLAPYPD